MSSHTPGPWRLEGRVVITDGFQHSDRNSEICTVSSSREFGTVHGENELFYNGQLIAAAPDLLAALIEAVKDIDDIWGRLPADHPYRLVIAKATGGEK